MNDPADLSNLRDIIFPTEVPLWPLAPGWWIVGVAIVASAIVLAAMAILHHRRNAYRRAALGELANIEHLQAGEAAQRITAVLKRAALVAYPRVEVAALSGEAWPGSLDPPGIRTPLLRDLRGACRHWRLAAQARRQPFRPSPRQHATGCAGTDADLRLSLARVSVARPVAGLLVVACAYREPARRACPVFFPAGLAYWPVSTSRRHRRPAEFVAQCGSGR